MSKKAIHPHLVFWIVIPFALACIRLLTMPQPGSFAPLPLAFNFLMILLGWALFHVATRVTVRFVLPASWRRKRSSKVHGTMALCLGGLIGSALLFPTRPLRMKLYCMMPLDSAIDCSSLALAALSWTYSSDFWRLATLDTVYWVLANQLVAWMFGVARYGYQLNGASAAAESSTDTENKGPVSPLLSKLPLELGDEPILLIANEHYLDVHTRAGNTMVLYRLSDAVKELGSRGVRVHRSFWVAYDAICGFEKKGAALNVVLDNGMTAPVSRGNRHLFDTERFQRMQVH